jgi:hypothetical protein
MRAMRNGEDVHAARRVELLMPVARLCAEEGVAVRVGDFDGGTGLPVRALLCSAADGSWDASVTVVRANRLLAQHRRDGHEFSRDPQQGYDLDSPGDIVYEVQVTEDDDGAGGHGPRPLVLFRLAAGAQAAADELTLWARRGSLFHTTPPVPDAAKELLRERRCFAHRQAAAAAPSVRVLDVPAEAAKDVAAIDHASLCWHFPRERGGRYQRTAVVALKSYGGRRPHLRDRWLTVRADAEGLVVTMEELIGVNQRHRWSSTPWLWDRRRAATSRLTRWQVRQPGAAVPAIDALRRGAVPEALELAGVGVDDQLARLLAGEPTRGFRAEVAQTWVSNLYAGLAESAPWRFAEAYRAWRGERLAFGLPVTGPVILFGLGGMGQQRKPKVALDVSDGVPILRLIFTGGNAVLPKALWTLPADLAAHLRGWQPYAAPRGAGARGAGVRGNAAAKVS